MQEIGLVAVGRKQKAVGKDKAQKRNIRKFPAKS